MTKTFLSWLLGLSALAVLVWYFGIKNYEHKITFTTKQPPGVVFYHVLNWQPQNGADVVNIETQRPFSELVQNVWANGSGYTFRWAFQQKKESKTLVSVYISDKKNGFVQKLKTPFLNTAFEKRNIAAVKQLGEALVLGGKKFNVHSITDTLVAPQYCACLSLGSTIANKAATMLRNIETVMGYIKKNGVVLQGHPFVEVIHWDIETQRIRFNFCFPIKKTGPLPENPAIQFKTTQPFKALKAEFNGNYSISDQAWYYLLDHAERHGTTLKKQPVEYFLNDPHS
ncbi:MAG: hypothetical protein ACPGQR_07830, partial [Marinirhabdus sp.]